MSSLFTSSSAKTSTTQQQVGVQGGTGVGAQTGANSIGSFGTGNIAGGVSGQTVNITTSDVNAIASNESVSLAALKYNQELASDATNRAYQTSIEALHTLDNLQGQTNLGLIAGGVGTGAAETVAGGAGGQVTSSTLDAKTIVYGIVILGLGGIALLSLRKT